MPDLAVSGEDEVVNVKEIEQSVQISISLPKRFIIENVSGIDEVYSKVSELSSHIKSLSNAAFVNGDKAAWNTVQALMYFWNYRDLMRIDRVKDDTPLVEYALRKLVLDAQLSSLPVYKLGCINNFTPERAIQELADKVFAHRINKHPLLEEMASHGLSAKGVKCFLENYYVNNRVFHLFIAALSLSSPLRARTELANNLYDEMGSGDSSMAHPELFLKNFNTIGAASLIAPLSESLALVNAKTYAAFLSGDYHFGLGGFGYIELAMPNQMRKILSGLKKSGLPRADLEFWEMHISIDEEHGKAWFSEMLNLVRTEEHAQKCLSGGMALLNARATMYDGILGEL